jgi:hypothetical protein
MHFNSQSYELKTRYLRSPSPKQLEDYDNEIVWAIRKEDIPRLEELVANGKW